MTRDEWERTRERAEGHPEPRLLVSSCQRIEVYHFGDCHGAAPLHADGIGALTHLAEVAAGLHSVVLGEHEILGQVRAGTAGCAGPLERLAGVAIAAARELRDRLALDAHTGHLLDRALRLSGRASEGSLLVVGAGVTARAVVARARTLGFKDIVVASRTKPDGAWFAEAGLRYVPLQQLTDVQADVVVTCLGSAAGPLTPAELPASQLVIDLGTPPNTAGEFPVPVVTIAALWNSEFGHGHSDARRAALREELEVVLARRVRMQREDAGSPVGQVRQAVERIRQQELERTQRLHPEIPAAALERITRSLVNQIFHLPSERLRSVDDPSFANQFAALFTQTEAREPAQ